MWIIIIDGQDTKSALLNHLSQVRLPLNANVVTFHIKPHHWEAVMDICRYDQAGLYLQISTTASQAASLCH